jgi:hypothetical protein
LPPLGHFDNRNFFLFLPLKHFENRKLFDSENARGGSGKISCCENALGVGQNKIFCSENAKGVANG